MLPTWLWGALWAALASAPAPAPAAEAEAVQSMAAVRRERAMEAYLRAIRPQRRQDEVLNGVLQKLRDTPGDEQASARLKELAVAASEEYEREVGTLLKPLSLDARERILGETYRSLLSAAEGDLSADTFLKALEDYEAGRLLSAWDGLSLVLRVGAGAPWMVGEAARFRAQLIPEAMELRA